MAKRDIIVIGASAGGVTALKELVESLPGDLEASIFVVQHVSSSARSYLPEILSHAGPLKAVHPADGDPIRPGRIYVAPPDHHLLVEDGRIDCVLVKKGPKENRFRPSIDALFRSAAYTYGSRVIGVVLTGLLNDGTSGMWSVKRMGGVGIIQKPDEALYASMPESVLEYVDVDHMVSLSELGALLVELSQQTAPEKSELSDKEKERLALEVGIAAQKNAFEMGILDVGNLTPLTCPECNGVLVSFNEGKLTRYRCHTGHAFTASALLVDLTKAVEEDLWKTVRGMEETVMLLEHMGKHLAEAGHSDAAGTYYAKARQLRERSRLMREFTLDQEPIYVESPANGRVSP